MLLRNLDPSNGLCNGTRVVCRHFQDNVIHAEITVGQYKGVHILLPYIPLSPAENGGYPFKFKRKQNPIWLCFAMKHQQIIRLDHSPCRHLFATIHFFTWSILRSSIKRSQWQTQRIWWSQIVPQRHMLLLSKIFVYKEVL